jgi:hypothetical protein
MDMTIKGLRLVSKKPYRVSARGNYGLVVSVSPLAGLRKGARVLQYATEEGDVVLLKKTKGGR